MGENSRRQNGLPRVALIHYKDDASVGGSLRVGQLIGNHLDTTRVDPHFVFAYGGPGPVTASSRIPVHFVRSAGPRDLGGWLRIRRLIHLLEPDIIHFVNPVFWISLALWDWPGPRVMHQHGLVPESISGWRNRLTYGTFRRSITRHVCVSRDVEAQVLKIGAAHEDSVCTIYNAIDCASFARLPAKSDARRHLQLPENAHLLGMVCRLVPEKGCADGILLMTHLPQDYHLVFCGTGPMEQDLKQCAGVAGLGGRVHFLGSLDTVQTVYAAIDELLFLSTTEPFGLVIAEAMASGVPVVGVAREGGYSDPEYPLVTQDNALLLTPDKPLSRTDPVPDLILQSLAQAIISLCGSPENWTTMALRAKKWVKERFEIQGKADELTDLYESLI
jgi:glycosyltransferase involved in cell wall biosynthesis